MYVHIFMDFFLFFVIRQFLSESPETCYITHYVLRHEGAEVNDFTEVAALIEVPPPPIYIYICIYTHICIHVFICVQNYNTTCCATRVPK